MPKSASRITEEAAEAASLYAEAEIDRLKLRLAKTVTVWSSRLIALMALMLAAFLILIFLGMAAAMALQLYFDSTVSFLIVAGVYLLFALIFILAKRALIEPTILKNTLKELFDES